MNVTASLRRRRAPLAWLALFALLLAQLAVSAYACPLLERVGEAPPPCHEIDAEAPALCKAFLQSGEQGLDKPRPLFDSGATALPTSVPALVPHAPCARPPRALRTLAPLAAAPPLIVLLGRRRD
jgi:hypothetical protein